MVQAMKLSAMPALILVLLWLCFFVCFVLFLVLDSMTVLCWKLDLLYSHSKHKNRKMMVQAMKFCAMSVVMTPDKQKNDRVQGKQAEENQLHEAEQERVF